MSKHKKKKESKKGFAYSTELYGILFILAAILGIGRYGPVGSMIASFAVFLVGVGYNILLVATLLLGFYLVIKRQWPEFFTTKTLGCYILIIGLLVIMHQDYVLKNDSNAIKVFTETVDQLILSFSNMMKNIKPDIIGGGMIGCTFAVLFSLMFSYKGMQIISWTLVGLGFCLFTGFSIVDFVKNSTKKAKEGLKSMEK